MYAIRSYYGLHGADRAVKGMTAGFDWDRAAFAEHLEGAARELALLEAAPRSVAPGEVRAYLAPRAMEELMGLLAWDAFSGRLRATKQSPLLRMEQGATLAPAIRITSYNVCYTKLLRE